MELNTTQPAQEVQTAAETVVTEQPTAPRTEPTATPMEPTEPQGEQGANDAAPAAQQTPEVNAAFAAHRREREAAQREEQFFRTLVGDLQNPTTGKPFESRAEWDAWRQQAEIEARAQTVQMDPNAYKQVETVLREKIKATDPDILAQQQALQEYRRREAEATFQNDLSAIKKQYPDEKAANIAELGTEFMALCANGISPLVAYEAVRAEKARKNPAPPSMGDVNTATAHEKDFFTREEVAKMSPSEVKKYFPIIRKSMKSW